MNTILSVVWEWRFVLVLAAAFVLFCLLEWQRTKTKLYALMLQAKRMAKDAVLNSGQEQEDWVVKKAMQFMPVSLRLFLSEDVTRRIVRWLFGKLKDYLDDGQVNGSVST